MDQEWTKEWQEGKVEIDEDTVGWMQSRPESVQTVMRKFPPSCLVRARKDKSLHVPAPGVIGVIKSYAETDHGVDLSVADHPDSESWARCRPEWLEVVGYYRGLDSEATCALLDSTTRH